jgi:SAM-dependent methyltransferase
MTTNQQLLANLKRAASDTETYRRARDNFITTFARLGIAGPADSLAMSILHSIWEKDTIEEVEAKVYSRFEEIRVGPRTVFELIQAGLAWRFELMFNQLTSHIKGVKHAIDYGCGAGVLTQMLHDRMQVQIDGVDVRDFRAENVTVPVRHFDGYRVPVADGHYQAAVLTNVIHHEAENERLLQELTRIATRKLVIIETVPEGEGDEEAKLDWGRMILNDALWNRFFNRANIPCPGTYETPQGWIRRFTDLGWHCTHTEDLGFDQPTIQDRHHLLVFER